MTQRLCTNAIATAAAIFLTHFAMAQTPSTDPPVWSVALGRASCAVTAAGGAKCWGANGQGQVGNGTSNTTESRPVDVIGLTSGVQSLAVGDAHTCALTLAGEVKCWGGNAAGQIGNGKVEGNIVLPPDGKVQGLGAVIVAIAAGRTHNCALTAAGGVKCWGENTHGELGNGSTADAVPTPVNVIGLSSGVKAIAAGVGYSCALMSTGGVKCWGWNQDHELGQASPADAISFISSPVDVSGLTSGVAAISIGLGSHACALMATGGVKCWGLTPGIGNTTDGRLPQAVIGLESGVFQVSAGYKHSCALLLTGAVKCWGGNLYGQLGSESSSSEVPSDVAGWGQSVARISAGEYATCVVLNGGGVQCVGLNDGPDGRLGYGGVDVYTSTPRNALGLSANGTTLVEFRYAPLDYYFLTSRPSEIAALDAVAGWVRTGNGFRAHAAPAIGSDGLNRYFFANVALKMSRGSHFYTSLQAEKDALFGLNPMNRGAPGLPFNEGVDSFIFAPTATGCAAGQTPVYRLFRGQTRFPDNPNHRFTTSLATYNQFVALGWDGEGIKMCSPN